MRTTTSRRRPGSKAAFVAVLALASSCAPSCASPEAERVRGGGLGGDVGNRSPVVEMHGGSEMYHDTPCAVEGADCTGPPAVSGRERGR